MQLILDKAAETTIGNVELGIFVLETWNPQPSLIASAVRSRRQKEFSRSVAQWIGRSAGRDGPLRSLCRPVVVDPLEDPASSLLLFPGKATSVWVPFLEGRRTVSGALHLHSRRLDSYGEQQLAELEALAASALPAIHRAVLGERMARAGTPLDVVGFSLSFLALERTIRLVARSGNHPVLITGERGSGKELAARAVHHWSPRRDRQFVPVLVSALSEGLYPAELFGHERSSFTGATSARQGKFKTADGGTLFLDEVADLSADIQSALLRVIDQGELSRVGRDLPMKVDVRVVTATNLDLKRRIREHRFRWDLYDRLSVFQIRVPPLRDRQEDIPLLANFFLTKYCSQMWRRPLIEGDVGCHGCSCRSRLPCVTDQFYQALQEYLWPGNVRELKNLILQLLATVPDEVLDIRHLPAHVRRSPSANQERAAETLSLHGAVKSHIERVLSMTGYNQTAAARLLDLPLSTLRSKIKRLRIEIPKPM